MCSCTVCSGGDDHLHARRGHRGAARRHPPRRLREGCALGVHPHGPVGVAHGPARAYAVPLDAGVGVGVGPARVVVVRRAAGVGALERVGRGGAEGEHRDGYGTDEWRTVEKWGATRRFICPAVRPSLGGACVRI